MKTFKEYLIEYDRGDIELQQQHAGTLRQAPKQNQNTQNQNTQQGQGGKNKFQQKMAQSPQKGDVIENKAGRFTVVGGSMKGMVVQQSGTDKQYTLPHDIKFQSVGEDASGRTIFKQV